LLVLIKSDRTSTIGKMIDSYLRSNSELDDHVIHLLFSANRWEFVYVSFTHHSYPLTHGCDSNSILQDLAEGITIICDRYAFSGICFSHAKGLSYEWCRSADIGLPAPDLIVLLEISPEKARERGGYGEERYEKEEMQAKVLQTYTKLGKEMREDGRQWVTLDAGKDKSDVESDIWDVVGPLVSNGVQSDEVPKLWENRLL